MSSNILEGATEQHNITQVLGSRAREIRIMDFSKPDAPKDEVDETKVTPTRAHFLEVRLCIRASDKVYRPDKRTVQG